MEMNEPFELEIFIPTYTPIEIINCNPIGTKEIELEIGVNIIEIPISIEPPKPIAMVVELHKMVIPIELNIDYRITGGGEHPVYPGPYRVVPKAVDQTLETRDKVMAYDVLVTEVPTYKTANPQGGFTFKILE